ncbi:MAG: M48 family metallopeptidase [Fervidicoccaceae archaeon]|jgi:predicted metal-dependent hydrolase
MSCEDTIKRIVEDYKQKLGISCEVNVKVRSYKTRSAFVNLKTKTIYINKELIPLGEDVLRYLILHELLHLKLNSKYHDGEFHKILYEHIPEERVVELRGIINKKLISNYKSNSSSPN